MSTTTMARRAAVPVALMLALSGCSGGDEGSGGAAQGRNAADVEFARQSLTHAAGTLLLVDEAAQQGVSPEVSAAVDEIRTQQTEDVEALTDLLEGWDEKVPATARDHAHGDHAAAEGHDELAGERGVEFEDAWLDLMADQHEDALDLAEAEVEKGGDTDAVRLAREMTSRLEQQVDRLERLEDRAG